MKKLLLLTLFATFLMAGFALAERPPGWQLHLITDDDSDYAEVTSSGGLMVVSVDYAHHKIHTGNRYVAYHQATLASGAAYQLLINTPSATSGKDTHFRMLARGSGEGFVILYAFPTVSNVGSAKEEVNRNFQSSNTAFTEITLTPTITSLGNIVIEEHFGSGPLRGGESFGNVEFILKPDTLYLVNAVSEAANNDLSVMPDWYEDSEGAP